LPYTLEQLHSMYNNLPVSAAGDDDIHVAFLRASTTSVRTAIYQLNSRCWELGMLPTAYTRAKVIPLYKGAGARNLPNSYRPISITSLLVRTHERLLASYFRMYILPHISSYQHGFVPGQSTYNSIHRVIDVIYRTISSGHYTSILSIDLAKAFDTVWVDGLLFTLHKHYHITGRAWLFIRAFVTNRTFRVVGDNMSSDLMHISAGVPQGSVLAPLLFIAYINRLAWHVTPYASMALYADDANAWPRTAGPTGIRQLSEAANVITRWATQHKMFINTNKSKLLMVSNKQVDRYGSPGRQWKPVSLSGSPVPYVKHMDLLGITIQGNGRWEHQSKQLLSRAKSLGHTLGRLVNRDGPPQPITIYTVVKAVLLSTILYALCLWRPTMTVLSQLDSAISWPLRYALCNKAHSVSIYGTLAEFAIPPLRVLRAGQLLAFQHTLEAPKSLRVYQHQSRSCARQQMEQYYSTPLPLERGTKKLQHPKYVRSMYREAQELAANPLRLPLMDAIHPKEWTSNVLLPRMSNAAWTMLSHSKTGTKANTITHAFQSPAMVGDNKTFTSPTPQLYLQHEIKPHSTQRARLRLNVADTPYRQYVCNMRASSHCLFCPNVKADRLHLLMQCSHYAKLRQNVRQQCFKYGIPRHQQDIYLQLGTIPACTPPLTKEQSLAIIHSTGALINAISEDLPQPSAPQQGNDQPP